MAMTGRIAFVVLLLLAGIPFLAAEGNGGSLGDDKNKKYIKAINLQNLLQSAENFVNSKMFESDPFHKLGWILKSVYQAEASSDIVEEDASIDTPLDISVLTIGQRKIAVDVVFETKEHSDIVDDLRSPSIAFEAVASAGYMTSGLIPIDNLPQLGSHPLVSSVKPAMKMSFTGRATSEGDAAMRAQLARTTYSVTGEGVRVGILSDSYDCRRGAATDIATGDLPPAADMLIMDDSFCQIETGSDEGRAMMQIVHDVAPGAFLAFHTAFLGQAAFADGIRKLAEEGNCNILVDDIGYFAEPMFQNGVIAQAADEVTSNGVAYYSAIGNSGRFSAGDAPSGFVRSGVFIPNTSIELHQSGTSASGDPIISQALFVQNFDGFFPFVLQWDEPAASTSGPPGCRSDVDIYIAFDNSIVFSGEDFNVGGDPVEVVFINPRILNPTGTPGEFMQIDVLIGLASGPPPTYMKWVAFNSDAFAVTDGNLDNRATVYGHQNVPSVAAVGAANWIDTPAFGTSPPKLESYSTLGGTPILIGEDGTRLGAPVIPQQPRFVGPASGANTFFGDFDGTTFRFPGTSASAPHVAAVGALMLQAEQDLTPAAMFSILQDTAIDINSDIIGDIEGIESNFEVGFDFASGYGLVDAMAAVAAAPMPPDGTCGCSDSECSLL